MEIVHTSIDHMSAGELQQALIHTHHLITCTRGAWPEYVSWNDLLATNQEWFRRAFAAHIHDNEDPDETAAWHKGVEHVARQHQALQLAYREVANRHTLYFEASDTGMSCPWIAPDYRAIAPARSLLQLYVPVGTALPAVPAGAWMRFGTPTHRGCIVTSRSTLSQLSAAARACLWRQSPSLDWTDNHETDSVGDTSLPAADSHENNSPTTSAGTPVVVVTGERGSGKTATVKAWALRNWVRRQGCHLSTASQAAMLAINPPASCPYSSPGRAPWPGEEASQPGALEDTPVRLDCHIWLDASSALSLHRSIRHALRDLGIHTDPTAPLAPPALLMQYLDTHTGWMLVYDNVSSVSALAAPFMPDSSVAEWGSVEAGGEEWAGLAAPGTCGKGWGGAGVKGQAMAKARQWLPRGVGGRGKTGTPAAGVVVLIAAPTPPTVEQAAATVVGDLPGSDSKLQVASQYRILDELRRSDAMSVHHVDIPPIQNISYYGALLDWLRRRDDVWNRSENDPLWNPSELARVINPAKAIELSKTELASPAARTMRGAGGGGGVAADWDDGDDGGGGMGSPGPSDGSMNFDDVIAATNSDLELEGGWAVPNGGMIRPEALLLTAAARKFLQAPLPLLLTVDLPPHEGVGQRCISVPPWEVYPTELQLQIQVVQAQFEDYVQVRFSGLNTLLGRAKTPVATARSGVSRGTGRQGGEGGVDGEEGDMDGVNSAQRRKTQQFDEGLAAAAAADQHALLLPHGHEEGGGMGEYGMTPTAESPSMFSDRFDLATGFGFSASTEMEAIQSTPRDQSEAPQPEISTNQDRAASPSTNHRDVDRPSLQLSHRSGGEGKQGGRSPAVTARGSGIGRMQGVSDVLLAAAAFVQYPPPISDHATTGGQGPNGAVLGPIITSGSVAEACDDAIHRLGKAHPFALGFLLAMRPCVRPDQPMPTALMVSLFDHFAGPSIVGGLEDLGATVDFNLRRTDRYERTRDEMLEAYAWLSSWSVHQVSQCEPDQREVWLFKGAEDMLTLCAQEGIVSFSTFGCAVHDSPLGLQGSVVPTWFAIPSLVWFRLEAMWTEYMYRFDAAPDKLIPMTDIMVTLPAPPAELSLRRTEGRPSSRGQTPTGRRPRSRGRSRGTSLGREEQDEAGMGCMGGMRGMGCMGGVSPVNRRRRRRTHSLLDEDPAEQQEIYMSAAPLYLHCCSAAVINDMAIRQQPTLGQSTGLADMPHRAGPLSLDIIDPAESGPYQDSEDYWLVPTLQRSQWRAAQRAEAEIEKRQRRRPTKAPKTIPAKAHAARPETLPPLQALARFRLNPAGLLCSERLERAAMRYTGDAYGAMACSAIEQLACLCRQIHTIRVCKLRAWATLTGNAPPAGLNALSGGLGSASLGSLSGGVSAGDSLWGSTAGGLHDRSMHWDVWLRPLGLQARFLTAHARANSVTVDTDGAIHRAPAYQAPGGLGAAEHRLPQPDERVVRSVTEDIDTYLAACVAVFGGEHEPTGPEALEIAYPALAIASALVHMAAEAMRPGLTSSGDFNLSTGPSAASTDKLSLLTWEEERSVPPIPVVDTLCGALQSLAQASGGLADVWTIHNKLPGAAVARSCATLAGAGALAISSYDVATASVPPAPAPAQPRPGTPGSISTTMRPRTPSMSRAPPTTAQSTRSGRSMLARSAGGGAGMGGMVSGSLLLGSVKSGATVRRRTAGKIVCGDLGPGLWGALYMMQQAGRGVQYCGTADELLHAYTDILNTVTSNRSTLLPDIPDEPATKPGTSLRVATDPTDAIEHAARTPDPVELLQQQLPDRGDFEGVLAYTAARQSQTIATCLCVAAYARETEFFGWSRAIYTQLCQAARVMRLEPVWAAEVGYMMPDDGPQIPSGPESRTSRKVRGGVKRSGSDVSLSRLVRRLLQDVDMGQLPWLGVTACRYQLMSTWGLWVTELSEAMGFTSTVHDSAQVVACAVEGHGTGGSSIVPFVLQHAWALFEAGRIHQGGLAIQFAAAVVSDVVGEMNPWQINALLGAAHFLRRTDQHEHAAGLFKDTAKSIAALCGPRSHQFVRIMFRHIALSFADCHQAVAYRQLKASRRLLREMQASLHGWLPCWEILAEHFRDQQLLRGFGQMMRDVRAAVHAWRTRRRLGRDRVAAWYRRWTSHGVVTIPLVDSLPSAQAQSQRLLRRYFVLRGWMEAGLVSSQRVLAATRRCCDPGPDPFHTLTEGVSDGNSRSSTGPRGGKGWSVDGGQSALHRLMTTACSKRPLPLQAYASGDDIPLISLDECHDQPLSGWLVRDTTTTMRLAGDTWWADGRPQSAPRGMQRTWVSYVQATRSLALHLRHATEHTPPPLIPADIPISISTPIHCTPAQYHIVPVPDVAVAATKLAWLAVHPADDERLLLQLDSTAHHARRQHLDVPNGSAPPSPLTIDTSAPAKHRTPGPPPFSPIATPAKTDYLFPDGRDLLPSARPSPRRPVRAAFHNSVLVELQTHVLQSMWLPCAGWAGCIRSLYLDLVKHFGRSVESVPELQTLLMATGTFFTEAGYFRDGASVVRWLGKCFRKLHHVPPRMVSQVALFRATMEVQLDRFSALQSTLQTLLACDDSLISAREKRDALLRQAEAGLQTHDIDGCWDMLQVLSESVVGAQEDAGDQLWRLMRLGTLLQGMRVSSLNGTTVTPLYCKPFRPDTCYPIPSTPAHGPTHSAGAKGGMPGGHGTPCVDAQLDSTIGLLDYSVLISAEWTLRGPQLEAARREFNVLHQPQATGHRRGGGTKLRQRQQTESQFVRQQVASSRYMRRLFPSTGVLDARDRVLPPPSSEHEGKAEEEAREELAVMSVFDSMYLLVLAAVPFTTASNQNAHTVGAAHSWANPSLVPDNSSAAVDTAAMNPSRPALAVWMRWQFGEFQSKRGRIGFRRKANLPDIKDPLSLYVIVDEHLSELIHDYWQVLIGADHALTPHRQVRTTVQQGTIVSQAIADRISTVSEALTMVRSLQAIVDDLGFLLDTDSIVPAELSHQPALLLRASIQLCLRGLELWVKARSPSSLSGLSDAGEGLRRSGAVDDSDESLGGGALNLDFCESIVHMLVTARAKLLSYWSTNSQIDPRAELLLHVVEAQLKLNGDSETGATTGESAITGEGGSGGGSMGRYMPTALYAHCFSGLELQVFQAIELGQLTRATAVARAMIRLYRCTYGKLQTHTLTHILTCMAYVTHAQGRTTEALSLFKRAASQLVVQFGPEHPRVAASLYMLGLFYASTGEAEIASNCLRQAVSILRDREDGLGRRHLLVSLCTLANMCVIEKRAFEAEHLLDRAEQVIATYDADPMDGASISHQRARLAVALGHHEEASTIYQHTLRLLEKASGQGRESVRLSMLCSCLSDYAEWLETAGRHGSARKVYARLLAVSRSLQQLGTVGDGMDQQQLLRHELTSSAFGQVRGRLLCDGGYARVEPMSAGVLHAAAGYTLATTRALGVGGPNV